jgi:hypothetical protein
LLGSISKLVKKIVRGKKICYYPVVVVVVATTVHRCPTRTAHRTTNQCD